MKKHLWLFSLFISTFFVSAQLPPGAVVHYPFDGNTDDISGNALHGIPMDAPDYVSDRFGEPSKAIHLGGYVVLPENLLNTHYRQSISLWAKTQDVHGALVGYQNTPADESLTPGEFVLPLYMDNTGHISGKFWDNHLPNSLYSNNLCNDELWHHIVIVSDSSEQSVYIDGILNYSYPYTMVPLPNAGYNQIGAGYAAGSWNAVNNYWAFFNGVIDDFLLYHRALTPQEIHALYVAGTPASLSEIARKATEIYPNPSENGTFTVHPDSIEKGCRITLVSPDGKIIASAILPEDGTFIPENRPLPGVYTVILQGAFTNTACKLLVR